MSCRFLSLALGVLAFGLSAGSVVRAGGAAAAPGLSMPQALQAAALNPPALNSIVVVDDKDIRLGDLFSNLSPELAGRIAGSAPPAGRPLVIEAAQLEVLARAYGLPWTPASGAERASVVRDARPFGQAEATALLREALSAAGLDPKADLEFTAAIPVVEVPSDAWSRIRIAAADYNRTTRAFSVHIEMPPGSSMPGRLRLLGQAVELVSLPVLARPLARKSVVEPEDLSFVSVPVRSLQGGVVMTPEDALGKSARRDLRAGVPLMARDLETPFTVSKGQTVALVYQNQGMNLSVRGLVLGNAVTGQDVRVQNVQSAKTIVGTVVDSHTVAVGLKMRPAAEVSHQGKVRQDAKILVSNKE